ncbi:hypothetical protein J6590_092228 [Homalodisca vitripennis]|nr:hypothetical protein J6590_092228 [Homalodisca vitripennis]
MILHRTRDFVRGQRSEGVKISHRPRLPRVHENLQKVTLGLQMSSMMKNKHSMIK